MMRFPSPKHMLIILAVFLTDPASAQPASWSDWRHGASGHGSAISAAERSGTPLVVYFHTDWCPWCRKLNEQYLRKGVVRDVLSRMERVEVNPEIAKKESALFREYGGNGYPSFYVLVPGSGEKPVKLSPFRKSGAQAPDEFSRRIQDAVSRQYDRWAHRLYKTGDRVGATDVLQKSLAFNQRNAFAHYLQGMIHHQDGNDRRDLALIDKARASYTKALELDPSHVGSRKGLEALRLH